MVVAFPRSSVTQPQGKIRACHAIQRYRCKKQVRKEADEGEPFLDQWQVVGKTADFPERHQDPDAESRHNADKEGRIEKAAHTCVLPLQDAKRAVMRWKLVEIQGYKGDERRAGGEEKHAARQRKKPAEFLPGQK